MSYSKRYGGEKEISSQSNDFARGGRFSYKVDQYALRRLLPDVN
jgi:hypothetical protein